MACSYHLLSIFSFSDTRYSKRICPSLGINNSSKDSWLSVGFVFRNQVLYAYCDHCYESVSVSRLVQWTQPGSTHMHACTHIHTYVHIHTCISNSASLYLYIDTDINTDIFYPYLYILTIYKYRYILILVHTNTSSYIPSLQDIFSALFVNTFSSNGKLGFYHHPPYFDLCDLSTSFLKPSRFPMHPSALHPRAHCWWAFTPVSITSQPSTPPLGICGCAPGKPPCRVSVFISWPCGPCSSLPKREGPVYLKMNDDYKRTELVWGKTGC